MNQLISISRHRLGIWIIFVVLQAVLLLSLHWGNGPKLSLLREDTFWLAWTYVKVIGACILVFALAYPLRARLISAMEHVLSCAGEPHRVFWLGVGGATILALLAWLVFRDLHFSGNSPNTVALWRSLVMLFLLVWLALASQVDRDGAASLRSGKTALLVFAFLALGSGLAPAVPLSLTVPLACMACVVLWRTAYQRSMVLIAIAVPLVFLLVSMHSPYVLTRVVSALVAPHDWQGQHYQWAQAYRIMSNAPLLGAAEGQLHLPRAADQYLLAGLAQTFGSAPALGVGLASLGLLIWGLMTCVTHLPRCRALAALRTVGIASAGVLLFSTISGLLANFAILRVAHGRGIAYFSPSLTALMLGAIVLVVSSVLLSEKMESTNAGRGCRPHAVEES